MQSIPLPNVNVPVPFSPEQASTFAPHVDALYVYLVALTAFFSLGITAAIIFFAVKYRRRHHGELPRPIAGSMALELTWTIIPLLISMTIFLWGASIFFNAYRAPRAAMAVYVVGKHGTWKVQHRTGQREVNERHVRCGLRGKRTMTTEDVIHSFYVPAVRIKQHVRPGLYLQTWFEAKKAGKDYLFCT